VIESNKSKNQIVRRKLDCIGVERYRRHLLLCVGPKCVPESVGIELWTHVKKRFKEKGLVNEGAFRSKVGCLRVCAAGAIAIVYPEGTWYAAPDTQALDCIIEDHIVGGKIAEKYKIASAESLEPIRP